MYTSRGAESAQQLGWAGARQCSICARAAACCNVLYLRCSQRITQDRLLSMLVHGSPQEGTGVQHSRATSLE